MNLSYWDVKDAYKLTEFYNQQIVDLPYCYPVTPDEFDWGIRHQRYDDTPHEGIDDEQLVVAERDGDVIGFVHLCTEDREEGRESKQNGLIRFLSYRPGYRAAGQALLEEAEKHLQKLDGHRMKAFSTSHIYRFYFLGMV